MSAISKQCLSCGTERTPQWRIGPNGRRTFCNACGVRFLREKAPPRRKVITSLDLLATVSSRELLESIADVRTVETLLAMLRAFESHRKLDKACQSKAEAQGVAG